MKSATFFVVIHAALFLMLAPASAAGSVGSKPALVVSSDDPALAALALAGAGLHRPVYLFDPHDPALLQLSLAKSGSGTECLRRSQTPPETVALMESTVGATCEPVDDPVALATRLWPEAKAAVVVDPKNDGWVLQGAAFGGATNSAVLALDPQQPPPLDALRSRGFQTLLLTPPFIPWKGKVAALTPDTVTIEAPDDLTRELLRRLAEPPTSLVIANPSDRRGIFSPSSLSLLAPLVSAQHAAPLFLTQKREAADIESDALSFIARLGLKPTHILLVGDELALRSHRVPDPVLAAGGPEARGGGTVIRVEIFSEVENEAPQDFAVGRIVAENATVGSALLARLIHDPNGGSGKPVRFLVNADSVFNLGETIARTTVNEFKNVKVPVKAYYRDEVTPDRIGKALGEAGVLVWEGHPRDLTLETSGGVGVDRAPDYVVLQGCYTFDRSDPFILIEKGTRAVVATSAAIYSAPGSAFARALFDQLLYEGADLGTAVRNARNYLLALARLQRERGHAEWHKTFRAALSFALWGDPTLRPPLRPKKPTRNPVRWKLAPSSLEIKIPANRPPVAAVGRYRADPAPRVMLGGLVLVEGKLRRVKDLYFAVVQTPDTVTAACAPQPAWDVVSLHSARTGTLYVLARPDWDLLPPSNKSGEFSFPLVAEPQACSAPTPTD